MPRTPKNEETRRLVRERLARHPGFIEAVVADAQIVCLYRAEGSKFGRDLQGLYHVLRLCWVSDAFLGQVLYRAKARMQALGIPVLPRLAHRLAMSIAQVCIGDPVIVEPGIYLAHGQVVIDGITEVRSGAVFFPWVTVGLRAGNFIGPVIGSHVKVGTGAKVIGPITVGNGSTIGANAVVVQDLPPGVTAAGVPARVVSGG